MADEFEKFEQSKDSDDSLDSAAPVESEQTENSEISKESEESEDEEILDVIIFGASSSVGKSAMESAIEVLDGLTWGIAGLEMKNLKMALSEVEEKTGKNLSDISIYEVNVHDPNSVREMVQNCKVLVNCVGPFMFLGEFVVKQCILAGTHYVDVSHEPIFTALMTIIYDQWAREKGVYVIPSCGFIAVAAEMGVVFAQKMFPGIINSIESFWENNVYYKDKSSKAVLATGAWDSFVYSLRTANDAFIYQMALKPKDYPHLLPRWGTRPLPHKIPRLESNFVPFNGGDRNIVMNSQRLWFKYERKRPIQYKNYIGFKSKLQGYFVPLFLAFISLLAQFTRTTRFLLSYVTFFTFGFITASGPTERNRNSHHYKITFRSIGWHKTEWISEKKPALQMWTQVTGYNPFYGANCVAVLTSAKMILQEENKIPGRGGVLSPGYAFARTTLLDELQKYKNGMKFETVSVRCKERDFLDV
uniref:Saccharopine dehydrogenase-like oxidoreductase n=1 Tax=Ceratitis capitata TaxID=7213 RepID=W8BTL6_CERCA